MDIRLVAVIILLIILSFTCFRNIDFYTNINETKEYNDPVYFHMRPDKPDMCSNPSHNYHIPNMTNNVSAQEKFNKALRDYDISSRRFYINE